MFLNRALTATASRLTSTPNYGFATKSLKLIKARMRAVDSIRKITKAMKMVAAAKMKQDVGRLEKAKGFGVGSVQKVFESESYLQKKKTTPAVKKSLLVPFTSDKGLCGGTNSTIVREVKSMIRENRNLYKIFVVGDKGTLALVRNAPDLIENAITNLATPMNFPIGRNNTQQPNPQQPQSWYSRLHRPSHPLQKHRRRQHHPPVQRVQERYQSDPAQGRTAPPQDLPEAVQVHRQARRVRARA